MPTFDQVMVFLDKVGMPWSVVVALLWIFHRSLKDIASTQEVMSKTLEHLTQHVIGQDHAHRAEERDHER